MQEGKEWRDVRERSKGGEVHACAPTRLCARRARFRVHTTCVRVRAHTWQRGGRKREGGGKESVEDSDHFAKITQRSLHNNLHDALSHLSITVKLFALTRPLSTPAQHPW